MKRNIFLLIAMSVAITLAATKTANAETSADVVGIDAYGGDLSAKTYEGIDFSVENLGVSPMALGSIINPSANVV